ncbi:MAG: MFS transporter [bacterium]
MEQFQHSVKRHHRWNISIGWLDGIFFALGGSMISHITVLPVFLRMFTESKFTISMVHSLTMVGIFIPQIFSAHYIESMPMKKAMVVFVGALMRLPWLILAVILPLIVPLPSPYPLVIFFSLYLIFTTGWGLVIPPWLDMMGRIILPQKRGIFMGIRFTLGRILAIPGAILTFFIIREFPFPYNFALCFATAFIIFNFSLFFFSLTREIPYPVVKKKIKLVRFLKSLPGVLRRDTNFLYYNISYTLIAFTNLSLSLYSVYAVEHFHLPSSYAGIFTALFLGSQAVTGLLWGAIGDRYGHKISMAISALMSIMAALTALTARSEIFFYASFLFAGGYISATLVSNMNIVLEFCPPEERPLYIGLSNTFAAPVFALSPIIGGLVVDHFSYQTVFMASASLTFIGLLVLVFMVRDPRFSSNSQAHPSAMPGDE